MHRRPIWMLPYPTSSPVPQKRVPGTWVRDARGWTFIIEIMAILVLRTEYGVQVPSSEDSLGRSTLVDSDLSSGALRFTRAIFKEVTQMHDTERRRVSLTRPGYVSARHSRSVCGSGRCSTERLFLHVRSIFYG